MIRSVQSTAAKIETAVAAGKILVITYPCNQKFDASLPGTNGGTTQGGKYLEQVDPAKVMSKEIFADLPSRYPLNRGSTGQGTGCCQKGINHPPEFRYRNTRSSLQKIWEGVCH